MKYRLTYQFCDTEAQAQELTKQLNKNGTYYVRKNKPAHFTPWESLDGKEKAFIVWYYI
jgi:hypothetical protein